MSEKFEQISLKPGFMKHNGGIFFVKITFHENKFNTKKI